MRNLNSCHGWFMIKKENKLKQIDIKIKKSVFIEAAKEYSFYLHIYFADKITSKFLNQARQDKDFPNNLLQLF